MPCYLVETFLARGDAGERGAREVRARLAAEGLTRTGTHVRLDRAIHVPGDEICFYVFSAPTKHDVVVVAQRARLDALRVIEAVPSREE